MKNNATIKADDDNIGLLITRELRLHLSECLRTHLVEDNDFARGANENPTRAKVVRFRESDD